MTDWQYFYVTDGPATDDAPPRSLGRTDPSGAPYNAQMLGRGAEWRDSEFLARYHLRGTNEDDYVPISQERAMEIIEAWVSSGRLPQRPHEPTRG